MKLSPTPLATPIATAALLALLGTAAQAQPAATPTQEVVVTGIRGSLQQSINQKRNAESRVEVITAEDIGKMPDKNVADSLQRVPGVTISSAGANEGGFDENDRVSMRGTSPSLTLTTINGHGISSGDWFVLNQTGTVGRSVSFSLLPSELVDKVIVRKSAEASLIEGGVVGAVDIITRKPLAFRKQLTLEAGAGMVYADLPGKTDPQFNGLINWKNDAGTLGVMLQAFSEHRHLRRDGQELLGYEQIKAGSAVATARPDLAGVWYPTLIGSALFEQKRERTGGLIDIQIRPTHDLTLDLSGFSSTMKAANYNRNYMLWATRVLNQGAGQAPDAGYVVRNNTLVSASFSPVAGTTYGVYDQISRPDAEATSNFVNLDASWKPNGALSLAGKLGTSSGSGSTPTQDVAEWNTGVGSGAAWRLNGVDRAADWSLGTANNASPAGLGLGWIFGDQNIHVKDKENWAQLDGEYVVDSGLLAKLKFGVRAMDHTRKSEGVIGQGPGCKTSTGQNVGFDWLQAYWCPAGTASAADPANFPQGFATYPGDFGNGLGGNFPGGIWYYTPEQLAAYNARLANRSTDGSRLNWNSTYALKEKRNAAYVQANLDGKGWSGNVGLRLVQTSERVTNNMAVNATTPGAVTSSAFGPFKPVSTEHRYTDVLPSANLRIELSKELVARLAAARTMTLPDYSALAASVALSPPAVAGGVGSGSGGNPDLKPVRSTNLDATLEWYFAPRSLLTASAFYMDLRSYVGLGQVKKQFMTYSAAVPQGALVDYLLTVPVNSSGKVKGLEFAYEQPLWNNFGVNANFTYTDANEAGGGPLVGASRQTYNLGGFYEDERFNVRVSYNHRSSFYSGLDRSTAFYQAASDSVSASFGVKINEQFSISLDARNLNNPKLKYYALNEDQPRSIYVNGRQFFLTARARF
ncbi:TonB-dependent receptor [Aquabacterium sp. OR-4]|uniref:TonB-dependent receptor n=1 Tax=Aquabacterium sp. OR-4 TaxID=2978127 RepID=UPI0028C60184|nr:TonB-dependent receptor [Aquabacterium sp. OR-4]MDT7836609.1 TonB-dependent receptor [Aquabacterium sp. OR-4]